MRPIPVIEDILSTAALWRGRQQLSYDGRRVVSSGWPVLDALLPGGGWPLGSLIEVGIAAPGSGECALFFPLWQNRDAKTLDTAPRTRSSARSKTRKPAQTASSQATHDPAIALIDPPFLPYAPGWRHAGIALSRLWWIAASSERQRLWAAEQSLRSGVCSAVLLWPQDIDANALRRLQLAAESAATLGLCFRPEAELAHASHAPIRLHLRPQGDLWQIELIKCRGRTGGARCTILRNAPMLRDTRPADQAALHHLRNDRG
jgi:hypothetical protein